MRGLGRAAALALIATHHPQADAATCKSFADKESTLMRSLVSMSVISESSLEKMVAEPAIANLVATMPWFSTCATTIDPMAIVMLGMESTTLSGCISALGTTSTELTELDLTTSTFKTKICPMYNTTVIPCIVDGVVDLVQRAMKSSNGCCDELNAKIVEWTGNDLKSMASLLLQYIGNVVCSQKTTAATNSTEYCGMALLNAVSSVSGVADPTTLVNIVQIPNSQVCSALTGSPFSNTLGVTSSLPIANPNDVGICFKPLDRLLGHVRSYPLVQSYTMVMYNGTKVALSDLFSDDRCVPGSAVFDWLMDPSSPMMAVLGVVDALLPSFGSSQPTSAQNSTSVSAGSSSGFESAGTYTPANSPSFENATNMTNDFSTMLLSLKEVTESLCFHLPNGASCAYTGQTITYAYPNVSGTVPNKMAPLTQQSGAAADGAPTVLIALTLLATTAAALAAGLVPRP